MPNLPYRNRPLPDLILPIEDRKPTLPRPRHRLMHILPQRIDGGPQNTPRQLMVVRIHDREHQSLRSRPIEQASIYYAVAPNGYMAQDIRIRIVEKGQHYTAGQWPHEREHHVGFRAARTPGDGRVGVVGPQFAKRGKNGEIAPGKGVVVEDTKTRGEGLVIFLSLADCLRWLWWEVLHLLPSYGSGSICAELVSRNKRGFDVTEDGNR